MSFEINTDELKKLRAQSPIEISLFVARTLAENYKKNPSDLVDHILTMEFTGKKEVGARIANAVGGYPQQESIPEKIKKGALACGISIKPQDYMRRLFLKNLAKARVKTTEEKQDIEKVTSKVLARTF